MPQLYDIWLKKNLLQSTLKYHCYVEGKEGVRLGKGNIRNWVYIYCRAM